MVYDFELVYEHFRKEDPLSFEEKVDPMVAEYWLKLVEAIFDHMELNDHQRVSCAAHILKMDAKIWWDVVKETRDLNTITWENFIQEFSKKYYSAVVLETKKFGRLARFAPEIVPIEAMRVHRFMRGLQPMITRDVKMTSVEMVSYVEVFNKALDAKYLEDRISKDSDARREANKNKGFHKGNKRQAHEGQSSGNVKRPKPLASNGNNHNNCNYNNNRNHHKNCHNCGNHQNNKFEYPNCPKCSR
ncbi:uncharacterized protein LOC133779632 [Humulus lupulus]|uniref:uncharacterized protein LOC133779632 n=1 Tax=Humulus lupulus TaxID=3486 RepID=UPI002B401092|nr:uncharacterized protein LOC133779632 [Humulus lupulus]